MCGSQGIGVGSACCPPAQLFQEKICGNFNGGVAGVTNQLVFVAPIGDYFEGTFEIFNSASSTTVVTGTVIDSLAVSTGVGPVLPGFSFSAAIRNPVSFSITAPPGTSGSFCITLYKRVLA